MVIFERCPPPEQKKLPEALLVREVLSHSCEWLNSGTENEGGSPLYRSLGSNVFFSG